MARKPSPEHVTEPSIVVLDDSGDDRGASFSVSPEHLAFLGGFQDMHVASIRPGHTRGNHYHATRRELIVIIHADAWSLHWDAGADTAVSSRTFEGAGTVAIAVPPYSAHAIRNDGGETLWLVAATDGPYVRAAPDAHRRVVSARPM